MVSLAESPGDILSAVERSRLLELECIVQEGLEGFLQVGEALAQIRDGRLYRGTHARWEDYCHDKWALSLSRCNQIIQTTATYTNLVSTVPQDAALLSEANEHMLRPLNRLEPELQTVTWELIRRIEERPTGISIQTVVDRIKGAIADGWEAVTDTDSREPERASHNGATRANRIPERRSDQLEDFCRLAGKVNSWDAESLALVDNDLCLRRHLKAARQLRTFCDTFIRSLEARFLRYATTTS